MEGLHEILFAVTEGIILFFEFFGVIVMLWAGLKGIVNYLRKSRFTQLHMAEGMAMALEFLLVGEILHTIIVREWKDLIMIGGLILIRVSLTLLINWEISLEKKECHVGEDNESSK